MLFWGILNPFLDLQDQQIFVFIDSYIYMYFLGQFKPFFTPKRDTLDTPQIIPNVHSPRACWMTIQFTIKFYRLVNNEFY